MSFFRAASSRGDEGDPRRPKKKATLVSAGPPPMSDLLRRELRACRRGVRVWVDVKTRPMPAPRAEAGEVKVTVRARVRKGRLLAALGLALGPTGAAIEAALKRAEQGKPKRARRAWRPPQVVLSEEGRLR